MAMHTLKTGSNVLFVLTLLVIASKGIDFKKTLNCSKKVKINPDDFRQILRILLDNAIKYSDKKIVFALSNDEMTVANDGAEIAEKDLPHVFERFYQADKSTEGVGLGLSIAKSVAMRNGWGLSAKSAKNSTEFILKF